MTHSLPRPDELADTAHALFVRWGIEVPWPRVEVVWSRRMRTAAGRAELEEGRILLNLRLLARVPHEVEGVLVHEAAHLAAHARHGFSIRPHGREWARLMYEVGHTPEPCHTYPTQGLARRRFWYLHLCANCGRRSILRAVRRMRCRKCGPRGEILVVRALQSPAGHAALKVLSLADAVAMQ